jgi:hypothetical protein
MKIKTTAAAAAVAAALLATGCGGGIGGTGAEMGTLRASVTDAPSCYEEVNVTIRAVRVHQSSGAEDDDAGWSEIAVEPAKRVNLVTLTNGVLEELGEASLPAGKYTQLRLVLAENDNADPLANSVVPIGGTETALATPSAAQSGLKLNVDIDVEADKVADVVLDFDACKSVVPRGNSGQYNLKPVITATTVVSDAGMRVVGYVDPSIALSTTAVSVQTGGAPVKATVPDAAGRFVLYPVPAGNYDLVVTSAGHVTAVMTGVPVVTTEPTEVNTADLPIAPGAATMRTVNGTVTPATAAVRALQTLTSGNSFEVSWGTVDATTGAFSFALPIEAPVKLAYVADPTTLDFTADAAVAGEYTLEARSEEATATETIDVSAEVPDIEFVFP